MAERRTRGVPRQYVVRLEAPCGEEVALTCGFRQLELLECLSDGPASRLQMLRRGRPRLGLNAPATVSSLRRKGVAFTKVRRLGVDRSTGARIWWLEYGLNSRVLSVQPLKRSERARP